MTTTLCPDCLRSVEHRSDFEISVTRRHVGEGIRTTLIANDTMAVHACDAVLGEWLAKGDLSFLAGRVATPAMRQAVLRDRLEGIGPMAVKDVALGE
jgi:hypothetical protein